MIAARYRGERFNGPKDGASPGSTAAFEKLLAEVRGCTLCARQMPHGVRPVVRAHPRAQLLVAGQAPGARVHRSGLPFDDPSGERLRDWMGIDRETFYDPEQIALLPMGFCYPGKGRSGDLPPPPICAETWRERLLAGLSGIRLTLVIGQYAHRWHIESPRANLTETVRAWASFGPQLFPLPHPSPRNNLWLKRNPWFENDTLPELKQRVAEVLTGG